MARIGTGDAALAMAEALSLALRGVDRATALDRLRGLAATPEALRAAASGCANFVELDEVTTRTATTWLRVVAAEPVGPPPVDPRPVEPPPVEPPPVDPEPTRDAARA